MGDTAVMALTPPRQRLTRKDWNGDAVLTLILGAVCLVAVFLPWANTEGSGLMNFGLRHPESIKGVLETQWGLPALGLSLTVLACGVLMLILGPGRLGIGLGVLIAVAGIAVVLVARDGTGAAYSLGTQAGLGSVTTLFAGVLIIPVGLAAAAVAGALLYLGSAAPTDPPAPESAPPS
jgi:hypothetical protein